MSVRGWLWYATYTFKVVRYEVGFIRHRVDNFRTSAYVCGAS